MIPILIGVLLVGVGLGCGGYAWLAAWLGMSLVVTGLGHTNPSMGPRIYGKNARGRMSLWAKVLHLPFLFFTWMTWHVTRRLSREHPYDVLTDSLIVGRRLLPKERQDSVALSDIAHWVDLAAEFEEPKAIREQSGYMSMPILDAGVPTLGDLDCALAQIGQGKTYVHCAQGHGRTALFALCLLLRNGVVKDVERGLALLKRARPGIALNRRQRQFVEDYAERLHDAAKTQRLHE